MQKSQSRTSMPRAACSAGRSKPSTTTTSPIPLDGARPSILKLMDARQGPDIGQRLCHQHDATPVMPVVMQKDRTVFGAARPGGELGIRASTAISAAGPAPPAGGRARQGVPSPAASSRSRWPENPKPQTLAMTGAPNAEFSSRNAMEGVQHREEVHLIASAAKTYPPTARPTTRRSGRAIAATNPTSLTPPPVLPRLIRCGHHPGRQEMSASGFQDLTAAAWSAYQATAIRRSSARC